ncbi:hypothetical protein, partial [Acinetobacter pittii]|uniref:hypothetical protein n=1 Tax=Acinetobacter pittii TaxID=48296 RepID=UPI002A087536
DTIDIDGLNSRSGRIAAIRPMSDPLISANVTRIETEIRRFDPNFRYQKLVPSGQPTYNINDVLFLQNRLFQFQARRQTEIDNLIRSANQIYSEQGITALTRAWDKHAGRQGGTFEPLSGNIVQRNEAANKFLRNLLNNPSTIRIDLPRGGFEYRAPNGQGVRFNADNSFSGLLDPKRVNKYVSPP